MKYKFVVLKKKTCKLEQTNRFADNKKEYFITSAREAQKLKTLLKGTNYEIVENSDYISWSAKEIIKEIL